MHEEQRKEDLKRIISTTFEADKVRVPPLGDGGHLEVGDSVVQRVHPPLQPGHITTNCHSCKAIGKQRKVTGNWKESLQYNYNAKTIFS